MTIKIPHWPVNHADIHKINQGRFIESGRIDLQFITALRDNTRFSLAMNGRYLVFSNFAIMHFSKSGDDARMYVALFSTLVLLLGALSAQNTLQGGTSRLGGGTGTPIIFVKSMNSVQTFFSTYRDSSLSDYVIGESSIGPEEWNPGTAENGF